MSPVSPALASGFSMTESPGEPRDSDCRVLIFIDFDTAFQSCSIEQLGITP